MKRIKRFPRPAGLTIAMYELGKERNEEIKQKNRKKINKEIIDRYISNNFRLNNEPITFNQLSTFLKIPVESIISRSLKGEIQYLTGGGMADRIKEGAQAVIGNCLFNVTRDRQLIEQQTDMLIKRQRGKYVPYLTTEVNKSLWALFDTQKAYLEIYKAMTQSAHQSIQILNTQNNFNSHTEKEGTISVLQAVELLNSRELPVGEELGQALHALYSGDSLPVITAKERLVASDKSKSLPYRTLQNEIDNAIEADPILDLDPNPNS